MAPLGERTGYSFIPGPFQYSAGVIAHPGHIIERVRFHRPVPLTEGFARIEAFFTAESLPLTAFCACELRSPAPFTDDGFIAFNRLYAGTLQRWGIMHGDENPVARSNVCPAIDPPATPSFHAFSFVRSSTNPAPAFVVAGSAEAKEGAGPYKDKTVRFGETAPDAIAEKLRYVVGVMENRMAALGASWAAATGTQIYTVHDFHACVATDLVARGAAPAGMTWHYCRPPVIGLDYEMDCRGVQAERVLPPEGPPYGNHPTIEDLERIYGGPGAVGEASTAKVADHVTPHYARFIAASPFAALATSGPEGLDCSPRGDKPGFVRIADPGTLLLPDRRGNNRIDSLRNVIRDPRVGLMFLVPGSGNAMRVNGRATIDNDPALLETFAVEGKTPRTIMVIAVTEIYFQCARALIRSRLWQADSQVDPKTLPTPGQILAEKSQGRVGGETYDNTWANRARETMW